MPSKAEYVRNQAQFRPHTCHWPGCEAQVPPAYWGCRAHWRELPWELRRKLWRAYRPGQEIDKLPSGEYLDVALKVQQWIAEREAPKPEKDDRIAEPPRPVIDYTAADGTHGVMLGAPGQAPEITIAACRRRLGAVQARERPKPTTRE